MLISSYYKRKKRKIKKYVDKKINEEKKWRSKSVKRMNERNEEWMRRPRKMMVSTSRFHIKNKASEENSNKIYLKKKEICESSSESVDNLILLSICKPVSSCLLRLLWNHFTNPTSWSFTGLHRPPSPILDEPSDGLSKTKKNQQFLCVEWSTHRSRQQRKKQPAFSGMTNWFVKDRNGTQVPQVGNSRNALK